MVATCATHTFSQSAFTSFSVSVLPLRNAWICSSSFAISSDISADYLSYTNAHKAEIWLAAAPASTNSNSKHRMLVLPDQSLEHQPHTSKKQRQWITYVRRVLYRAERSSQETSPARRETTTRCCSILQYVLMHDSYSTVSTVRTVGIWMPVVHLYGLR